MSSKGIATGFATVLFMAACDDLAGGFAPLPRETFVRGVIQAACEEIAHCSDPVGLSYSSVERCVRFDGAGMGSNLGWVYDNAEGHYDQTAAQECLQWLQDRRARCNHAYWVSRWLGAGSPCARVFGGWAKLGQACKQHVDCAEGSCVAASLCGKGVCGPASPTGAPCTSTDSCGFGIQCGANKRCRPYREPVAHQACDSFESCGPAATCLKAGICWPNGGLQAKCSGASGGNWAMCGPGLQCSGSGSGLCKAAREVGEACTEKFKCPKGLLCADGACAYPAKDGESCSADRANCTGWDRACRPGPAGKLVCAPLPDRDAPCLQKANAKDNGQRCAHGLYCDPATVICLPWSGAGQPCQANSECSDDTACVKGTCVRDSPVGALCPKDASWVCADNAWCNAGVCVARSGLGGPCGGNPYSACMAGLRCDGTLCVPPSTKGGPCAGYADCAVGLVCSGATCVPDPCKPPT